MNANPGFCGQCGAPLTQGARFCGQCGQPVGAAAISPASPPAVAVQAAPGPAMPTAPVAPAEPVLGFVPTVHRRSGFMGLKREAFTVMVTSARLVFVPIGGEEMKQAMAEARERAKQAGKGVFGQWGAQLGWLSVVQERLMATPVDTTLASRPGSFSIPLSTIRCVKINVDRSVENSPNILRLIIETQAGKQSYELTSGGPKEVKALLKQALGDIVK